MTTAPDPRVSLTPRAAEIARAARELLEQEGVDALSMRNIAARLGIRAASLYEHFTDKRAVENAIIAAGMWEQGDFIAAAVKASDGSPVLAIATAFRAWAKAHPTLYKLITSRDLDRDAPDVADAEQWTGANIRAEVGEHRETGLALWAFSHGVVDLELNQRFPPGFDVDVVWRTGVDALNDILQAKLAADRAATSGD